MPEGYGRLAALRVLRLDWTRLSGPLPAGLFERARGLAELSLASNAFSGPLPVAALARLSRLTDLRVSFNRFGGRDPTRELALSLPRCRTLHTQANAWDPEDGGGGGGDAADDLAEIEADGVDMWGNVNT